MKAEGKGSAPLSFVEQVGEYASPHCGYCGSDVESVSMVHAFLQPDTRCMSLSCPDLSCSLARRIPHMHGHDELHLPRPGHVGTHPHARGVPGAAGQGLEALRPLAVSAAAGEAGLQLRAVHHPLQCPHLPGVQGNICLATCFPRHALRGSASFACMHAIPVHSLPHRAGASHGIMCCACSMQAQRRALRKFEAYLAGAPLAPADETDTVHSDPMPPQTPPLYAEQAAELSAAAAAAAGQQAYKKRRHCRGEASQDNSGPAAAGSTTVQPSSPSKEVHSNAGRVAAAACTAPGLQVR
jgi:hypothetical protein